MGHVFTTSTTELAALSGRTCDPEGVACWVHETPQTGLVPLYRAHSSQSKTSYLTTSVPQLLQVINQDQFQNKGICGYVHPNSNGSLVPLYALYSPQFADYLFTTNWAEVQHAVTNLHYTNMGTVCYVEAAARADLMPMHRLIYLYDSEASVNMIAVGGDAYTESQWQGFLESYERAAAIYRRYLLRLRLNGVFFTPAAESMDRTVIDSEVEAGYLTSLWSGPEGAIDVFGVWRYSSLANGTGGAGWSPIGGSCDHDGCRSGVVVEWISAPRGQIMAHELGHYWDLQHDPRTGNLMYDEAGIGFEDLDNQQVSKLKAHCTVVRY